MAKIYYVDVAVPADKKKRKKHKTHAVFDGSKVFRVKRLTELEDAAEVFIDALFPELYDEVLELLKRGVRVYLLKDPIRLKKLRMENNMRKSDESDAMLLTRISRERFRLLSIKEVELKTRMWPLINEYEQTMKWKKTLKRLMNRNPIAHHFEEVLRFMERDRERLSREIIRQVANLPVYGEVYRKACEMLGVKNSAELAILTLELPLHLPLCGLKGLLGLNPNRTGGRFNHRLRHHLAVFAAGLYMNSRKRVGVSDKIIEVINNLPRWQAIIRLELMALKALRIAYLTTMKPLTGG